MSIIRLLRGKHAEYKTVPRRSPTHYVFCLSVFVFVFFFVFFLTCACLLLTYKHVSVLISVWGATLGVCVLSMCCLFPEELCDVKMIHDEVVFYRTICIYLHVSVCVCFIVFIFIILFYFGGGGGRLILFFLTKLLHEMARTKQNYYIKW